MRQAYDGGWDIWDTGEVILMVMKGHLDALSEDKLPLRKTKILNFNQTRLNFQRHLFFRLDLNLTENFTNLLYSIKLIFN